ncbi:hypothetical protein NPIL_132161 [Nephila pilipes]|uniref:Uncharacterized protein n=1 Tax=Nephila pilipes TaxID=299642 RepID=A0A8X6PBV4_NEPPI|nr:hypothetical protein NPIL_132161 [Nephila pilipes]
MVGSGPDFPGGHGDDFGAPSGPEVAISRLLWDLQSATCQMFVKNGRINDTTRFKIGPIETLQSPKVPFYVFCFQKSPNGGNYIDFSAGRCSIPFLLSC